MSSGYTLRYALNVALEDESLADRQTIASIPVIVTEILRQTKEPGIPPIDARATMDNLEHALDILLERLQFSVDYDVQLKKLSTQLLDKIMKSPSTVAGIMGWERLKADKNIDTLSRIAVMGNSIMDELLGGGDRPYVKVDSGYLQRELPAFVKPNGLVQSYLRASSVELVDDTWTITLNTHPEVDTTTEAFGPIEQVYTGLVHLFHHRFRGLETRRLGPDLAVDQAKLKYIFEESASIPPKIPTYCVPPEIPTYHEKQFDVATATLRGKIFASDLERLLGKDGDKIVQNRNFFSKIDTLMTYGTINP